MSADLAIFTSPLAATRLCHRLVFVLLWCGLLIASSRITSAGCDFGYSKHAKSSSMLDETNDYARQFRVLGQWVYERGQVKYVAWQAEGECQGPNCSGSKEPIRPSSGMSLPHTSRTNSIAADVPVGVRIAIPQVIDELAVKDPRPFKGYPPAYEYPP